MLKIKINEKDFVNEMLNYAKETLKEEVKNEIDNYNIWDNENISKTIENFFTDLVIEVLNENKEKIKQDVKETINNYIVDLSLEVISEKFNS